MPQIALVTGTSSGMGLHTAVGLAGRGITVVATLRDPTRAEPCTPRPTAAGVRLDIQALDVTDHDGAARCVDEVLHTYGRLDILINNAGRGSVGSLEQLSMDDLRAQLEVNYLGVAAMTKLALTPMRLAGSGRIVTVTSVGGAVGQPFADAYCGGEIRGRRADAVAGPGGGQLRYRGLASSSRARWPAISSRTSPGCSPRTTNRRCRRPVATTRTPRCCSRTWRTAGRRSPRPRARPMRPR